MEQTAMNRFKMVAVVFNLKRDTSQTAYNLFQPIAHAGEICTIILIFKIFFTVIW